MRIDSNAVGSRGEWIVAPHLTRTFGHDSPYFRPKFLGEKYPILDFFVELVDAPRGLRPFFLVQVKSTSRGLTADGTKLPVRVGREDLSGLTEYPAPTYIFGIDERLEAAYLFAAITGGAAQLSSLPTAYPLNETNLRHLYQEVLGFWQTNAVGFTESRFV